MVIGAFPAAKLGALLLRQVSKPIANSIKEQAKNSPFFRTYVCMPPAQFYNWCEVKAKMWILNLGRPVNIPVLNEAMAIELGANLLGEAIIFVIAAGVLINEYNRSARKEAAKEQAKEEETAQLHNTIRDLFFETQQQAAEIREIKTYLYDLETKVVLKPSVKHDLPRLREPKHPPPPSAPPPLSPPSPPASVIPSTEVEGAKPKTDGGVDKDRKNIDNQPECINNANSLLLKAVSAIENEFWNSDGSHRGMGIISISLDHIYKNVYRMQTDSYCSVR